MHRLVHSFSTDSLSVTFCMPASLDCGGVPENVKEGAVVLCERASKSHRARPAARLLGTSPQVASRDGRRQRPLHPCVKPVLLASSSHCRPGNPSLPGSPALSGLGTPWAQFEGSAPPLAVATPMKGPQLCPSLASLQNAGATLHTAGRPAPPLSALETRACLQPAHGAECVLSSSQTWPLSAVHPGRAPPPIAELIRDTPVTAGQPSAAPHSPAAPLTAAASPRRRLCPDHLQDRLVALPHGVPAPPCSHLPSDTHI